MELVSFIMSTYNEPLEWVQKSLSSIMNQTYSNIEVVVVVDNPGNTPVITYLDEQSSLHTNVIVLKNKENIGLVKSLNHALDYCKGRYIARMDADDISMNTRIERELDYLNKSDLDIVGSGFCDYTDETGEDSPRYNPKSSSACKSVLKYRNCTLHPSWVMKREVYEELNGYREIKACEDYDLLTRAILKKYKIGNIPEALVLYRNNPNSISHINLGEQKAIMEFLGKAYRSGRIRTIDEYALYLKSEQLKNDAKKLIEYFEMEERLDTLNWYKKVFKTVICIANSPVYRREKIRNQYIKTLLIMDRIMG